jgi:hypothetical protein
MSEIKVNKISPVSVSGTTLFGDSGDTFTIPSGATFSNLGTATGFGAGGKVVQIAQSTPVSALATGTTGFPIDDTVPTSSEGHEFLTLAFTPTSATNKLLIQVQIHLSHTVGTTSHMTALFKDSDATPLCVGHVNMERTSHDIHTNFFQHYMTSGSTSAITFKVRAGGNTASTMYMNVQSGARCFGGTFLSYILIMEIDE